MHRICGRVLATASVLIPALSLHGQSAQAATQPYTAEFEITTTQRSGDIIITRTGRKIFARDSQGRTREESTPFHPADQPAITTVIIEDRVENTHIAWNSTSRIASVIKRPPPLEEGKGCWSSDAGDLHIIAHMFLSPVLPPQPDFENDDLGTQTIMGLAAHGTRTITTTPVGEAGNDRPLVEIIESWWAPVLGISIRESTDDQRGNKSEMQLITLDLDEPPDPSKFQPPPDKEVQTSEMHRYPCPEIKQLTTDN